MSLVSKVRLWLDLVRFSHTVFALPFAPVLPGSLSKSKTAKFGRLTVR